MEERSNSYTVMATSADEESYALESVVREHHVYMNNWTPVIGEMLQVHCEDGNTHDRYAVASSCNGSVVGHVPIEFSRVFVEFSATWWQEFV